LASKEGLCSIELVMFYYYTSLTSICTQSCILRCNSNNQYENAKAVAGHQSHIIMYDLPRLLEASSREGEIRWQMLFDTSDSHREPSTLQIW